MRILGESSNRDVRSGPETFIACLTRTAEYRSYIVHYRDQPVLDAGHEGGGGGGDHVMDCGTLVT